MLNRWNSLIVFLAIPILSYSSNIAKDTLIRTDTEYFRIANIIFAERDLYKQRDSLCEDAVILYQNLYNCCHEENIARKDSILLQQNQIAELNSKVKEKKKSLVRSVILNILLGLSMVTILIL